MKAKDIVIPYHKLQGWKYEPQLINELIEKEMNYNRSILFHDLSYKNYDQSFVTSFELISGRGRYLRRNPELKHNKEKKFTYFIRFIIIEHKLNADSDAFIKHYESPQIQLFTQPNVSNFDNLYDSSRLPGSVCILQIKFKKKEICDKVYLDNDYINFISNRFRQWVNTQIK